MAKSNPCACTGIRCCLRCGADKNSENNDIKYSTFVCCYLCGKTRQHQKVIICERRPPLLKCTNCSKVVEVINIKQESPSIETITVYKDFLSVKEEAEVVKEVDCFQWVPSQSGRNKQVRVNRDIDV